MRNLSYYFYYNRSKKNIQAIRLLKIKFFLKKRPHLFDNNDNSG